MATLTRQYVFSQHSPQFARHSLAVSDGELLVCDFGSGCDEAITDTAVRRPSRTRKGLHHPHTHARGIARRVGHAVVDNRLLICLIALVGNKNRIGGGHEHYARRNSDVRQKSVGGQLRRQRRRVEDAGGEGAGARRQRK